MAERYVRWGVVWVRREKLTQTAKRVEREKVPEGLEIYYYSRFKQQRLVGNSGCGRGEWNRGGVELPKSDNGPGPNLVLVLSASVLLVGPQRRRCCTAFFTLPISTGTIYVQVLYSLYCIAYGSCVSGKGTPRSGDRQTKLAGTRWTCAFTPWQVLVIHA